MEDVAGVLDAGVVGAVVIVELDNVGKGGRCETAATSVARSGERTSEASRGAKQRVSITYF